MEEYRRHNLVTVGLCAAGVAVNLLLSMGVTAIGMPLYLDTVGSVTVAAMGGYLPGIIVGFVTNIVKSTYDASAIYYGGLNVLIAFATTWMAQKGWMKRAPGIIGMILVLALIGGGLGAAIPWFMDGLAFDSESLADMLYETGIFSGGGAYLTAGIITDLSDKTVTVLIAVIICRLVPDRYHEMFSFTCWMQSPDSSRNILSGESSPVRVMSFQKKILLMLGVSLTTVAVVGAATSYNIYQKTVISERSRIAQRTVEIAAGQLDGDRIDDFLEHGPELDEYRETERSLANILKSAGDIAYLYVYRIEEDGCHVVFDIDTEETPGEETGTVIAFDEGFADYIPRLLAGREIDPIITNDQYGYLLTAYKPVYSSDGKCACYVGADVDMEQILILQRDFLVEMTSIFLGFFILLCAVVIWLTNYHIIYPVNAMTGSVDAFLAAGESQESMDQSVRSIRSIDIHTGDEVEKLYQSICELALKQTEQMRNIRHFSESTAKMQDGLIITMADLVENRDSDTGAHIQKTAAYVKIIVEGLKRKGYYAEKITPKFMSDVVRSAPLHDVGKINIPDEILNKPGKLTDEEYGIMKIHTVMGGRIIEKAINTVEGENYLKEARNMARYHHERWDGKGYPDGLHGEVIPLSARIMAVADVFDALTSPRVYKPAFPLNKALSMIQEGAGTQFDAKCVEVLMEALPEVKVILKKYNEDANVDAVG